MMDTQQMSSVLREPAESGAIPGVVATVADAGGTIFEAGFGKRDATSGAPMTPDTVVWIASMTKAVTATCAMQLVEQGKLSLNEPIATIVPELGRVQVLEGFDGAGKPRLRAARRPITLRQLLTHTSGFAYDLWNAEISRYMEATGTPGIITCQNAALTLPLIADPGEKWEYGISIDWVGKAVEAVSGVKLDRYMRENLLDPLGMSDTTFRITDEQRRRLARVHARTSDGIVVTDTELPQAPEFHMGGGGLYSTVGDYSKFTQMILHAGRFNGVRVLRPETVATMSSNAMGNLVCNVMKSAVPSATNDVEFLAGMKWGLSFLINPDKLPAGRSAGSLAWAGLANSYYWIDPTRKVTGVFATQLLPFFDAQAVAAFQAFESAVYASL
jgi:methyl acetate hydrolase